MKLILPAMRGYESQLIEWRHHLHQYPELGFDVGESARYVSDHLGSWGYDVATGDYTDLVKAGIVDPKKVTRTALQNASSIAGLLLTTECLITEIPEKEKKPVGGPHGGGMGGDMGDY